MKSLTTRWKSITTYKGHDEESPATPTAKGDNIDSSYALKSVIKTSNTVSQPSPRIGMNTHLSNSETSIQNGRVSSSSASTNSNTSGSLLNLFQNFIESSDSLNELEATPEPAHQHEEEFEKLPTDLLLPSTLALNRSVGGGSSTCLAEYYNKWPVPESIEQVKALCEQEKLEGNAQSQLALCLHLMESAWQVDPNNNMVLSPTTAAAAAAAHSTTPTERQPHNILSTLLPLKLHEQQPLPSTFGEAMVVEARHMLKQLANSSQNAGQSGEAEAQFLLGSCYGMGALGWPINHYRAFQWYNQASKQSHPEATYRTAVCYELGIGTEKDDDRAIVYYRKAAHLLHVPSMYKLGVILFRGYCSCPVSKREAVVWLKKAATTAMAPLVPGEDGTTIGGGGVALPHALHALAIVQLTRECEDTSMIPDDAYAIKLLHNAARLGYAPSQSKLGECYECGHFCPEDEAQSIYWYTLAAKQNYPEACLALSGWYLTGSLKTDTLMQSDTQAYLWARKAASLAKRVHKFKSLTAKAYYTLGMYHENGIGVQKSSEVSMKWHKKAAQYGHPEAIKLMQPQLNIVL
jgi:TPR repeat protein